MISRIWRDRLGQCARSAIALATLTAMGCSGPQNVYTTIHYQYKETVVVETPQGLRSGSSVIEVILEHPTYPDKPKFAEFRPAGFNGQAVAVDLPNGKTVFALLSSHDDQRWAESAFFNLANDKYRAYKFSFINPNDVPVHRPDPYELAMRLKGPQTLPREWPKPTRVSPFAPPPIQTLPQPTPYPFLVTFRDPNDPSTLTVIDPDQTGHTLGKGYKLKEIVLELTDAPASTGIEHRLPWLAPTNPGNPGFSHAPQTPPNMAGGFGARDFTVQGTIDKDHANPIM